MLFKNLAATATLSLEQYADVDHFRESERYVRAESIPLAAGGFAIARASLALQDCSLSLVRTFPRLINGYDTAGRLVIVVPMNEVSSARINGEPIGQSVVLLKGNANCTVYEPEGRLVAILSIRAEALHGIWLALDDQHLLLDLSARLPSLQSTILAMLQLAADEPLAVRTAELRETMQQTLFLTFDDAMQSANIVTNAPQASLVRYKQLVDAVDRRISQSPMASSTSQKLADEMGISIRTLQTAVNVVCGSGLHHYGRLRRLWSVRRQLRMGFPGLTVKASALAHGFQHMSEFSNTYRLSFGELPSDTLARARQFTAA